MQPDLTGWTFLMPTTSKDQLLAIYGPIRLIYSVNGVQKDVTVTTVDEWVAAEDESRTGGIVAYYQDKQP